MVEACAAAGVTVHTLRVNELTPRLRAFGLQVYDPDLTLFTQAGGGVHCRAQPLRRGPG